MGLTLGSEQDVNVRLLQEVRIEISRVNEAAGQTVFKPAATEALDSVIKDLS